METLPQLCTELIAQHLGKLCKDPREAAWNGASLSLVGALGPLLYPNDSNTGFVTCEMSRIVYEFADPGSLKARGDALNNDHQKGRCENSRRDDAVMFPYFTRKGEKCLDTSLLDL